MKLNLFFLFMSILSSTKMTSQNVTHCLQGGTTTITLIQHDKIIIAADGLQTATDSAGKIIYHQNTSKIQTLKNVYFTFTGEMLQIRDGQGKISFSAYDLMRHSLSLYDNIDSSLTFFNQTAYDLLNKLFLQMPPALLKYLKSKVNQKLLEGVMVTIAEKGIILKNWDFGFIEDSGNIVFKIIEKPFSGKLPYMFYTGYSDEIKRSFSKILPSSDEEIINEFANLIKLEIKANPDRVGFPIDVVTIYENKAMWQKFKN